MKVLVMRHVHSSAEISDQSMCTKECHFHVEILFLSPKSDHTKHRMLLFYILRKIYCYCSLLFFVSKKYSFVLQINVWFA